ncbi:Fumarate reductase flavoprotein C-term [Sulfitobacter brevis]|uniref:L-aspartate oxidase n=1 Tax=Sulfitobacter brevis TaxID=74348 RepID=A0A1I2F886_9RHOB|nr:Fumarate reductase flavoprotein C-term [Sulfitobacter brevis]
MARGVFAQTQAGLAPALDTRQALGTSVLRDFTAVAAACLKIGLDPLTDPIPVAAAAHYHMGGIATDHTGQTSLPGLWACGEAASTGLHGANRLASNGLLEALVYGQRCAVAIDAALGASPTDAPTNTLPNLDAAEVPDPTLVARLRQSMTDGAGVIRDAPGLQRTLDDIAEIEVAQPTCTALLNMTATATLIATGALNRCESRGAHFRSDYPETCSAIGSRSFQTLAEAQAMPTTPQMETT